MKTPRYGWLLCLLLFDLRAQADVTLTILAGFNYTNRNQVQVGGYPSTLVQGTDGNLYGTTRTGGANGFGTVFMMTPDGSLRVLACLPTNTWDKIYLGGQRVLVQRKNDGNFYGTMFSPASSTNGAIFMVTPSGTFFTLATFTGDNGTWPVEGLVEGPDSNLYGTTQNGGAKDLGTVFKFDDQITLLHSFKGSDGVWPVAGLTLGADGNFYGVANATVFRITARGDFAVLYSFEYGTIPSGRLLQAKDGYLYGTTSPLNPDVEQRLGPNLSNTVNNQSSSNELDKFRRPCNRDQPDNNDLQINWARSATILPGRLVTISDCFASGGPGRGMAAPSRGTSWRRAGAAFA